jgi:hypothetical protein
MWSEYWPLLVLAAAFYVITRPRVWYGAAKLPWRLAWRVLRRRR